MSREIIHTLAITLAAGTVVLSPRPLLGQSETETIYGGEHGVLVRYRDEGGALVERFTASGVHGGVSFTQDRFLDDYGDVVTEVTR